MNRTELQALSNERTEDARALLAASCWSGAYYLAGYSVECALKSCVLAHVERTGAIFQDKKYAEKCWTHDLEELVKLAGLSAERDTVTISNARLADNWLVTKDWSEISRYRLWPQSEAEALFRAIDDNTDGVLQWLKNYW